MSSLKSEDTYKGSLMGLAVGDALGAPIEMSLPGTFEEVCDMQGGGYFNLAPGEWTDDTALALCSAKSLIECRGFDPKDHLERFLKWYRQGYMSTRKEALGIGVVTAGALMCFESTGEDFCGPTGEKTAHNGSLMCVSPIVLAYAYNYEQVLHYAGEFSRLTHGAPVAVDACRYLAHCIVRALQGVGRKEVPCDFEATTGKVRKLASGTYFQKPDITKETYADALTALHGALWGLVTTDSFEEGVLKVANLGWDADTMGAVYGQLAGALYGFSAIPKKWSNAVAKKDEIVTYAQKLYELSKEKETTVK